MTDQPKFKPGDRVRRIETRYAGVEPGDELVVDHYIPFGSLPGGTLHLVGRLERFAGNAFELVKPPVDESATQRAAAFDRLSGHPYFEDAYRGDGSLIDAMVAMLDDEVERSKDVEVTEPPLLQAAKMQVELDASHDEPDFTSPDVAAEQGWQTAPGALIDLTPQAALLASYGLEVRVQTRPKPAEAPAPTVAADVNLDAVREAAVRSGIEQAVEKVRHGGWHSAAAYAQRALLGDSAKGGE